MKVTMKIEGMMCPHCEAAVKKALEAIPAVESAEVSHEKGEAVVGLSADTPFETLKNAEPPKDYTMETILEWLESIKKAPDQRAVELLIKKITVFRENNKTDFKIESNLKSVCVEMVAGGRT